MPLDQGVREILVRADELEAVVLEDRGVGAVAAHRLALEDEIGDPADQILDAQGSVKPQLESAHGNSVHGRHQEFVKHAKKVSKPTQKVLG